MKEPKADEIVTIVHPTDGTRVAVPYENYGKFYESDGWTIDKHAPEPVPAASFAQHEPDAEV